MVTGDTSAAGAAAEWLSLPELVEALGEPLGRVRRLLDENHLIASRRHGGGPKVPAAFVVDGRPLPALRGTAFVLHDAGFSDDEVIDWLLTPEDSLGTTPLEALTAGRKSEVRRIAQALG
ncbi:MAG: Rv2175c family DNA-binding protein [Gemmatimonadota bacterium]|nr:Rv2175c family DNA-binding protein [Gemmatimonadota bacterium]